MRLRKYLVAEAQATVRGNGVQWPSHRTNQAQGPAQPVEGAERDLEEPPIAGGQQWCDGTADSGLRGLPDYRRGWYAKWSWVHTNAGVRRSCA